MATGDSIMADSLAKRYSFVMNGRRSRCIRKAVVMDDEEVTAWAHSAMAPLPATKAGYTHGERRAMSYDGVGHDEDEGQLRRCTN